MGSYDTVVVPDTAEAREGGFVCASGHSIVSWQSKDLGCGMETYVIRGRRLWTHAYTTDESPEDPANVRSADWAAWFAHAREGVVDGVPILQVRMEVWALHATAGVFDLHDDCRACLTHYLRSDRPEADDRFTFSPVYVFQRLRVEARLGRIVRVVPGDCETPASAMAGWGRYAVVKRPPPEFVHKDHPDVIAWLARCRAAWGQ